MPKTLEVTGQGARSTFAARRLDRSSLYGRKLRLPVDAHGCPCANAALTRDGRHVLPAGSTATLYLDDDGEVVERQDLRAAGADGAPGASCATFLNGPGCAVDTAGPTDLLDHTVTHVYALDPVSVAPALDASLTAGAVYRVRMAGAQAEPAAFLLKNDAGFFFLVGEPTGFGFVAAPEVDRSVPDEGDLDDLDFDMM